MKPVLYASFTLLCLGLVHSAENFNALIFNRFERSLIKLPREVAYDAKSEQWASACPAKSDKDDEGKYNKEKSFSKNALFVRKFYNRENLSNIKDEQKSCNKPFKLSVAMPTQEIPAYYEFGYEIHFNTIDSKNFEASDIRNYKSIEDTLKTATSVEYLETRPKLLAASGKRPDDLGFIWIPLFKVMSKKKQLRRIEYEIHRNNINTKVDCQDYSLGEEIFEGISMNEFYSQEAQQAAFKSINLPSEASRDCKSHLFKCFEKALLIPADQFRFGLLKPRCSNMTTIPIWGSVVREILTKVDTFLYTLSRISDRPLRITAGVHKNLHFLTRRAKILKYILLKSQRSNLHVPKIIYKVVRLKLDDRCKNEDPKCWSGIVIVIHNYPNFNPDDRICEDKTESLGWEEITYGGLISTRKPRSKNIYICAIDKKTFSNIGLDYDEKISISELSLKDFPYKINEDIKSTNMKKEVFNELRRLAKGGKIEIEDTLIKRPFLHDDNFLVETDTSDESEDIDYEDQEDEDSDGESEQEVEEEEKENTVDDEDDQEGEKEKVLDDDNKQKGQKDHEVENGKEQEEGESEDWENVLDDESKPEHGQKNSEIINRKEQPKEEKKENVEDEPKKVK